MAKGQAKQDDFAKTNARMPTVVLPCPPDQFREFIAGLLGRLQTIEFVVKGPFELTKDNAENLRPERNACGIQPKRASSCSITRRRSGRASWTVSQT
jgi:hypothetical protein